MIIFTPSGREKYKANWSIKTSAKRTAKLQLKAGTMSKGKRRRN
jgi:hypothetical protein